ncbi:MAG TPA: FAD-dependent thymidylate synthase [Gemmatimonadaceae bacterium]|nr:FAD-dependent thymidylate synthase [Gemmatimonadaceae bacterium]
MPQFHTEPKVSVIARPAFAEPAHLPVHWLGESTDGERLAEFAGRLCYMSQKNPANRPTRDYLENIKKQGHGSVLEHATYSLLLEGVSRSLTHELVRHRAGWAYCLAGETLVYSERRSGSKRDGPTKRRVRDLFAMTQSPHGRSRLKLLKLRCLDEATGSFIAGRVRTVVASGIKPVFRVTLEDGKTITCTREHRFLTPDGWRSLDDALGGLRVSGGGRALAGRSDGSLMVNGEPAYRSKEWLRHMYHDLDLEQGVIADEAGVSVHCIRSWVRQHRLQKPLGLWTAGHLPWNRGIRYRAGWQHSLETRALLGNAKRGARNPQWRGGITRRGVALRRDVPALRALVMARDSYACRLCGTRGGKLTMHHVLPIWARPDLANDPANLVTVCRQCHSRRLNGHELDHVSFFGRRMTELPEAKRAPRGGGRLLVPRARRIVSVDYVGERETFDIEMEGPHHNFVANGIITHNSQLSQRYVDESHAAFVIPPAILGDEALVAQWKAQMEAAQAAYVTLVEKLMERHAWVGDKVHRRKMAREAARGVLPNSTETKIVVTGNARAWRTMLELRCGEGAEMEIRRCAVAIVRVLQAEAPGFFSDFEIYTAEDRAEAARIGYHKV